MESRPAVWICVAAVLVLFGSAAANPEPAQVALESPRFRTAVSDTTLFEPEILLDFFEVGNDARFFLYGREYRSVEVTVIPGYVALEPPRFFRRPGYVSPASVYCLVSVLIVPALWECNILSVICADPAGSPADLG